MRILEDPLSISPAAAAPALSDREFGDEGERLAADYLASLGYRIVMTNFTVPVGRNSKGVQKTGEIDIVALDGDVLCFVEVKTRRSEAFTSALTAIDKQKQRQITRTSKIYRRTFRVWDMQHRFDAVSVVMDGNSRPDISLHRSFWTEASLRKRNWSASANAYFD